MVAPAARSPRIACAEIGRVEVASVLHRKLRESAISASVHRELHLRFEEDIRAGVWILLPVTQALLARAQAAFRTLPAQLFLRSADCVHLCAAAEAGCREFCSSDRHLLAAADRFEPNGIDVLAASRCVRFPRSDRLLQV